MANGTQQITSFDDLDNWLRSTGQPSQTQITAQPKSSQQPKFSSFEELDQWLSGGLQPQKPTPWKSPEQQQQEELNKALKLSGDLYQKINAQIKQADEARAARPKGFFREEFLEELPYRAALGPFQGIYDILPKRIKPTGDPEYDRLQVAKTISQRAMMRDQERTGVLPALERVSAEPERVTPFVSAAYESRELYYVWRAAKKYERGEKLTPGEDAVLRSFALDTATAERFNPNFWDQVAESTVRILPYTLEFAATYGSYTAGREATITALRGGAEESAKIALKRAASKKAAETLLERSAGWLGGTAAQTVTMPEFAFGTSPLREAVPKYKLPDTTLAESSLGEKIRLELDKQGDDPLKALSRGYGRTFIETLTERMGGPFEHAIGWVEKRILNGWLSRMARKFPLNEQMLDLAKRAGWDGIAGEWFEEQVAKPLNEILSGNEAFLKPIDPTRPEVWRQWAVEAASIGLFGTGGRVWGSAVTYGDSRRNAKVRRELEQREMQGITEEERHARELVRTLVGQIERGERVPLGEMVGEAEPLQLQPPPSELTPETVAREAQRTRARERWLATAPDRREMPGPPVILEGRVPTVERGAEAEAGVPVAVTAPEVQPTRPERDQQRLREENTKLGRAIDRERELRGFLTPEQRAEAEAEVAAIERRPWGGGMPGESPVLRQIRLDYLEMRRGEIEERLGSELPAEERQALRRELAEIQGELWRARKLNEITQRRPWRERDAVAFMQRMLGKLESGQVMLEPELAEASRVLGQNIQTLPPEQAANAVRGWLEGPGPGFAPSEGPTRIVLPSGVAVERPTPPPSVPAAPAIPERAEFRESSMVEQIATLREESHKLTLGRAARPAEEQPFIDIRLRQNQELISQLERELAEQRAAVGRKPKEVAVGDRVAGVDLPGTQPLTIPGGRTLTATLRIVDGEDLKPSHDPITFQPTEGYPENLQERLYHKDRDAQTSIITRAQAPTTDSEGNQKGFVVGYVLPQPAPGPEDGPSMIRPDGVALGGNNRLMVVMRMYRSGQGEYYKTPLLAWLGSQKVDQAVVDRVAEMNEPVLVREIQDAPTDFTSLRSLVSDLNRVGTRGLSEAEAAVSAGTRISQATLDWVSTELAELGEGKSLRDLMRVRGADLLDRMQTDGVVSPTQRTAYFDLKTGEMNDKGKDLFERALLGAVLDDPELLMTAPADILRKLEGSIASLARLKARQDAWDITDYVKEAVRDHTRAATPPRSGDIEDYYEPKQRGLMAAGEDLAPPPTPHPITKAIAFVLDKSSKEVKSAFAGYTRDAESQAVGQRAFYAAENPWDSFKVHFGVQVAADDWGTVIPTTPPPIRVEGPPPPQPTPPPLAAPESRTKQQIVAEIDALVAIGRRRMDEADPSTRALRPAEVEWLEPEERQQLHDLQLALVPFGPAEQAAARERVKEKRAARALEPTEQQVADEAKRLPTLGKKGTKKYAETLEKLQRRYGETAEELRSTLESLQTVEENGFEGVTDLYEAIQLDQVLDVVMSERWPKEYAAAENRRDFYEAHEAEINDIVTKEALRQLREAVPETAAKVEALRRHLTTAGEMPVEPSAPPALPTMAPPPTATREVEEAAAKREAGFGAGFGASNTLFTKDRFEEATKRLREKFGRLQMGIDPTALKDLIEVGGFYFEGGLRDFASWSKRFIEEHGRWVTEHLPTIWRDLPARASGRAAEMVGQEKTAARTELVRQQMQLFERISAVPEPLAPPPPEPVSLVSVTEAGKLAAQQFGSEHETTKRLREIYRAANARPDKALTADEAAFVRGELERTKIEIKPGDLPKGTEVRIRGNSYVITGQVKYLPTMGMLEIPAKRLPTMKSTTVTERPRWDNVEVIRYGQEAAPPEPLRALPHEAVGREEFGALGEPTPPAARPAGAGTERAPGRGVRPGGEGGQRGGLGLRETEALARIPAVKLDAAPAVSKAPVINAQEWADRLRDAGLPDGIPPPTEVLSPDVDRKLIFEGQPEVAAVALSGLRRYGGAVIATSTGTGKTYVGSAILAEEKPRYALVLTKNQALVETWREVGEIFGLDIQPLPTDVRGQNIPPGIWATTYSTFIGQRLDGAEKFPWELVVADESGEARRWYEGGSQTGAKVRELGMHAAKMLYMSATPFHIPLELGYLEGMRLWRKEGFERWVGQFGVRFDEYQQKWIAPANPRKLVKLRAQLIERGQYIDWPRDLRGYSADFGIVPLAPEQMDGLARINKAFEVAEEYFKRKGASNMIMAVRGNRVTFIKNYLERSRLPEAVEVGRKLEEQGWKVIFFSENKREVSEIFDFLRPADEWSGGEISANLPQLPGVVETLQQAFGDSIANYSGSHSAGRTQELVDFRSNRKKHLYATYGAGGMGVSMHDTDGDYPRAAVYLGPPWSGVMFDQAIGRPWRFGTKSNVHAVYLLSDSKPEVELVLRKVYPRLAALRALVSGIHEGDPIVEGMRSIDAAFDYELGNKHRSDGKDFMETIRKTGIHSWKEVRTPSAEEGKQKGMQVERRTFEPMETPPGERPERPPAPLSGATLFTGVDPTLAWRWLKDWLAKEKEEAITPPPGEAAPAAEREQEFQQFLDVMARKQAPKPVTPTQVVNSAQTPPSGSSLPPKLATPQLIEEEARRDLADPRISRYLYERFGFLPESVVETLATLERGVARFFAEWHTAPYVLAQYQQTEWLARTFPHAEMRYMRELASTKFKFEREILGELLENDTAERKVDELLRRSQNPEQEMKGQTSIWAAPGEAFTDAELRAAERVRTEIYEPIIERVREVRRDVGYLPNYSAVIRQTEQALANLYPGTEGKIPVDVAEGLAGEIRQAITTDPTSPHLLKRRGEPPKAFNIREVMDFYLPGMLRVVHYTDLSRTSSARVAMMPMSELKKYSVSYVRNFFGVKEKYESDLTYRMARSVANLTYAAALEWNPSWAALNLSQTLVNTWPELGQGAEGYVANGIGRFRTREGRDLVARSGVLMDMFWLMPESESLRGIVGHPSKSFRLFSGYTEALNRGIAYLAGLEKAKDMGFFGKPEEVGEITWGRLQELAGKPDVDIEAGLDFAYGIAARSQFMYTPAYAQLLIRRRPLLMQFKSYIMREAELVASQFQNARKLAAEAKAQGLEPHEVALQKVAEGQYEYVDAQAKWYRMAIIMSVLAAGAAGGVKDERLRRIFQRLWPFDMWTILSPVVVQGEDTVQIVNRTLEGKATPEQWTRFLVRTAGRVVPGAGYITRKAAKREPKKKKEVEPLPMAPPPEEEEKEE